MQSLGLSHLLQILLQILTCIMLLTPSFAKDDREIYIVYMGVYPKDTEITDSFHTSMVQSVIGSKFVSDTLLHRYKTFNGFVARLTKEESEIMKGMDGVVSVIPNRVYNVQTSRSWDFLNFPENVPRTNVEGNTIVGVIDSGIWISNSNSFTDGGFGPPPPKWKGTCNNFTCNNKVIGARYFRMGGVFTPEDIISPTDTSGHGSHCASTAAGNRVPNANLLGLGSGIARGGVPSARIAVYKVCWTKGCETIDILAGFDAAIADGVDIISISVGPTKVQHLEYFQDDIAIGAYHAMKSGILTSKTADNLGPNRYTMVNLAPWFLSVAASTIDRKFFTDLKLGNGQVIQGISVNTFSPPQNGYPLVYGGDVPAPGFNSSESSNPTAIISKSYERKDSRAPYIAPFSSRGPNRITPNILKPDIAAPGVDILAAWSPISPISSVKGDNRTSYFNIISGTSMACPHVTATAVYVKSFHPSWSPAVLKSALMTTATPLNSALNPDAEFAYGAGQINPLKAVNPGLVYDVGPNDYINFLCGQGYSTTTLRRITGDNNTCTSANRGSVFNLNLPSFALATARSSYNSVSYGRTVTNVGSARSTYRAIVSGYPSSLNIQVVPNVLTFTSLGQRLSFTLRIQGTINADLDSFSLTWDDGTHQVRSPIVVYVP
ncbi:cucumisin-like isoform X2 [Phaseolus vulgaris]|uniref:cucumisin-like isoform X2 n=1 Tax=Phaseolus vulgaris TaxID=3885 RepID=UPI0035CA75AB